MIIGFLGKGGSGKSTLSSNFVKYLRGSGEGLVLAVDADHNMDMTFNLGIVEEFPYLGSAMGDLKRASGLEGGENYREALFRNAQGLFTLSPKDAFTEKYTKDVSGNLLLMTAGPQTDDVLSDRSCSHVLFTPLKVYLPLLALQENEWVVVDEKAGADGVSTGIPTGFDLAVIVAEPTVHSMKAAKQIAGLLEHYDVPFEFVINKASADRTAEEFAGELGRVPLAVMAFDQAFAELDPSAMQKVYEKVLARKGDLVGKRLERSRKKFEHFVEK